MAQHLKGRQSYPNTQQFRRILRVVSFTHGVPPNVSLKQIDNGSMTRPSVAKSLPKPHGFQDGSRVSQAELRSFPFFPSIRPNSLSSVIRVLSIIEDCGMPSICQQIASHRGHSLFVKQEKTHLGSLVTRQKHTIALCHRLFQGGQFYALLFLYPQRR